MDELVQRQLPLRHIDQLGKAVCFARPAKIPVRALPHLRRAAVHLLVRKTLQAIGIRVIRLAKGKILIGSVCAQAHSQLRRCHAADQTADNPIVCNLIVVGKLFGRVHIRSQVKGIASLFQHPGRFAHAAEIVIAGKVPGPYAYRNPLRLPRLQKARLPETDEHSRRFPQKPLRCTCIQLDNLTACIIAGIGNGNCNRNLVAAVRIRTVCSLGCGIRLALDKDCLRPLHRKARIGKPVAKRIDHLLRCSRKRFEIPVSDIDILGIIHVIAGFMEPCCGRIILQASCKGVGQLAGRGTDSQEKLRRRSTALQAALPGHQNAPDAIIAGKPVGCHHTADVHDNHHAVKGLSCLAEQLLLCRCQIEVTALKQATLQLHKFLIITDILTRSAQL